MPEIIVHEHDPQTHTYNETKRLKAERITNGGGIVCEEGFRLTGLAYSHPEFRGRNITALMGKPDGIHIYLAESGAGEDSQP